MMRTAALVACVWCASCGAPTTASTSAGSTVAFDETGRLWVTSPDDGRIVAFDAATLTESMHVDVAGAPQLLVPIPGALAVTLAQSSDIALVSTDDLAVTRVAVPCGGTRGIAFDGTHTLFVSCPNDDLVIALELGSTPSMMRVLAVPDRPTALAIAGDRIAITSQRTGVVRTVSLSVISALPFATTPVPVAMMQLESVSLESTPGHAASQADALAASDDGASFVAAFQRVDHDSDRTRAPAEGGYGSVVDGNPRIEPRLLSPCGGRYAHFDGGVRAASGPSAVALAHGVLWVVNQYTDSVLALSCTDSGATLGAELAAADREPTLLGAFRTGRGPRGLVVSADGRTAYVDVGFDHAVARLALDDVHDTAAATPPRLAVARTLGPTTLSTAALRGRALFHDAVDTHLTPSGIVTCATCHPGGGDDGLSWFLHTTNVGPKLRRTPAAWGARPSLAPFHWDAAFTDAATLSHTTIVELMNGDALVVDTSAIAAYMAEIPLPPPLPLSTDEAASASRGQALFASAGCATCHSGPLFSDGALHAVIPASSDPDATLAMVDTPSLVAVRARAPYFHDGRAATLRDTLDATGAHGHTAALTSTEIDDLLMYLRSL